MKDIFKNIFRRAQNFEGFMEYFYVSYEAHWNILPTGNNNELMFIWPRWSQRSLWSYTICFPSPTSHLPLARWPSWCSLSSPSRGIWQMMPPSAQNALAPEIGMTYFLPILNLNTHKKKKFACPSNIKTCPPSTPCSFIALFFSIALNSI